MVDRRRAPVVDDDSWTWAIPEDVVVFESDSLKLFDGIGFAEPLLFSGDLVTPVRRQNDPVPGIIPRIDGLHGVLHGLVVAPANDSAVDVNEECGYLFSHFNNPWSCNLCLIINRCLDLLASI